VTVLVDTSVWSLSLRKSGPADHPAVRQLASLLDGGEDVVLTGLILQEILQAFRKDTVLRKMARYLEPFPILRLRRDDYLEAAKLHRKCAANGISTTSADCQIAAAAIRHGCSLLTTDRDFERIAGLSSLKVLME
jgi:predicted nucleic acid-binding protein